MPKFTSVELRKSTNWDGMALQIWVTGTDGGWSFQTNKGNVYKVNGLLVVLNNLSGVPVAVLPDEAALADYCAQRFGVRP